MKRSREPEVHHIDPAYPDDGSTQTSVFESRHTTKYAELDLAVADSDDDGPGQSSAVNMRCFLPPHSETLSFTSYNDYETHYNSFHTNRCLECRKNLPSQHLLGVHIEECHDPIVRVKRDQGEHTYSCFVEGCERKCLTHQKRRMHMIDKHMYPKNFFFAVTRDGIDGRRSMLNDGTHRRRRSSTASQTKGARRRAATLETEDQPPGESDSQGRPTTKEEPATKTKPTDADVDAITGSMASLRFVPGAVKFGNRGRAGFAKQ